MNTRFTRNDYLAVHDAGGPDALNRLLVERYPDPEVRNKELQRMRTTWITRWDSARSNYVIMGRRQGR